MYATADVPTTKAEQAKMMKKYQAECDLKCLIEAEAIKKDKTRYAAAMKAHAEQMAALESVED